MRLLIFLTLVLSFFALNPHVQAEDKNDPHDLSKYDAKIKPAEREHWSFLPIARPKVPKPQQTAWVRNPIDAFILSKLESKGWQPAPAASSPILLRRLFLDLTGLPPTLAEQEAFLKNPHSFA